MARGKLAIGFAHPDQVSAWFLHALLTTISEDWRSDRRIRGRIVAVRSGPMIDRARNDMCRAFLGHPDTPDWLLMVDADMVWEPSDLRRLFQAADEDERPILAGLCFAGGITDDTLWPTILQIDKDSEDKATINHVLDYPRDALCQVDATGAAFILIHRQVLESMRDAMGEGHPAPWFAFTYMGQVPFGEDVTFCLRAAKIGIPVHVHTGVRIGHAKTRILTEDLYDVGRGARPLPRLAVAQ